ncbi:MAG: CopD family protein [Pseudomonadota bacterium]
MLYATLKTAHLLAVIAWVGGMFFMLACLRPSLGVLDGPVRPKLMSAVMARFFAIVNVATLVVLLTGLWMLWSAWRAAAGPGAVFSMPPSWHLMIVLGLVMMGVFGHVQALFRRLRAALQAQDGAAVAPLLDRIRKAVLANLVMGVIIVVTMKLGAAA